MGFGFNHKLHGLLGTALSTLTGIALDFNKPVEQDSCYPTVYMTLWSEAVKKLAHVGR